MTSLINFAFIYALNEARLLERISVRTSLAPWWPLADATVGPKATKRNRVGLSGRHEIPRRSKVPKFTSANATGAEGKSCEAKCDGEREKNAKETALRTRLLVLCLIKKYTFCSAVHQ